MTPTTTRFRPRPAAAVALALAGALVLAGCSGDSPEPPPTTSGDATTGDGSSTTGTGTGSDQSASVLGLAKPTAAGKAAATRGRLAPGTVLQVWSVRSTPSGTVLAFSLSANAEEEVTGRFNEWEDMPVLHDPKTKTEWSVTTYVPKNGATDLKDKRSPVGSSVSYVDKPERVRYYTALYPTLPDSVTTVQVKHDDFAPATVPVTR